MGGWEAVAALDGAPGAVLCGGFGCREQSRQSLPVLLHFVGAASPIPACLLGLRGRFPRWGLPSLWDVTPELREEVSGMVLGKKLFMGCCRSDCIAFGVGNFRAQQPASILLSLTAQWSRAAGTWVLHPALRLLHKIVISALHGFSRDSGTWTVLCSLHADSGVKPWMASLENKFFSRCLRAA